MKCYIKFNFNKIKFNYNLYSNLIILKWKMIIENGETIYPGKYEISDENQLMELVNKMNAWERSNRLSLMFKKMMIINNINGTVNQNAIGEYDEDIYMMKYNEVQIQKKNVSA